MQIPKIIHQIWSDKYQPLPDIFRVLAQTWRECHPNWEYRLWGEQDIDNFIREEYAQYYDFYHSLPFDMQRWDAARFLILNKFGGMHVDCDYECLENIEPLFSEHTCCVALEPDKHCIMYSVPHFLNSALLATIPHHPFLQHVIDRIFSESTLLYDLQNKPMCILNTTGPLMLSTLYSDLIEREKSEIYLLPAKFVTPFDCNQIVMVKKGLENEELENCLKEAYAIHYSRDSITELLYKNKSANSIQYTLCI